jgi:hypothetical protein
MHGDPGLPVSNPPADLTAGSTIQPALDPDTTNTFLCRTCNSFSVSSQSYVRRFLVTSASLLVSAGIALRTGVFRICIEVDNTLHGVCGVCFTYEEYLLRRLEASVLVNVS